MKTKASTSPNQKISPKLLSPKKLFNQSEKQFSPKNLSNKSEKTLPPKNESSLYKIKLSPKNLGSQSEKLSQADSINNEYKQRIIDINEELKKQNAAEMYNLLQNGGIATEQIKEISSKNVYQVETVGTETKNSCDDETVQFITIEELEIKKIITIIKDGIAAGNNLYINIRIAITGDICIIERLIFIQDSIVEEIYLKDLTIGDITENLGTICSQVNEWNGYQNITTITMQIIHMIILNSPNKIMAIAFNKVIAMGLNKNNNNNQPKLFKLFNTATLCNDPKINIFKARLTCNDILFSVTSYIQPLININKTQIAQQAKAADQKYSSNNHKQYKILFLNMRGGLETKIQRNAAFMNFYNNLFKDILGCCELKTRSMDSYTILPRAKTIFKPGYYKIMEKNDHNWICNGMSVTIIRTQMEKIAVMFAYVPPYQNCEARIENIYKDIGTQIDILETLGYQILVMGDFNGRNTVDCKKNCHT
ncbi:hypothetical protein RFI_38541 [Reticulomyxa filosa]|uniref:Endonuclease/exonuclease/phosphatase domain-containing protein n=1 Tax=Reticulomyxa filosa TaxID=46433 RepID=X6LCW7_RETFI|nr:hypothetical protein RFI_38541 [Reticulomyxa filosa]|eukprot:ETN98946.1 hypothetical protein RFI_38541 [Reticulomyxa filosa]